jgi:SAM-dependent methyltransferase
MDENSRIHFSDKAADRGEPSYVWRAGQERRFSMIKQWAGSRIRGLVLESGCGVGEYLARLGQEAHMAVGLDVEFLRLVEAKKKNKNVMCAASEHLPFRTGLFDLVLSNEVIEHVQNDKRTLDESVRVMKVCGRLALFCPNRGYPFETHGIYVKGQYHFGNKIFINYLPRFWRDRLAPHVRVYTRWNLRDLFKGLPVKIIHHMTIFGAYDNIIQKWSLVGKVIRGLLQFLEKTPLRVFGLSHFWVVEKIS